MPSRRDFLQTSSLVLPGLFLPWTFSARSLRSTPVDGPTVGLFFDAEVLPDLQARYASDPMFAMLRERLEAIDRTAERRFLAEEVRYNDHLYDIARVSNVGGQMAFVYAMTGDENAAELATSCARTLMNFPKWDYFLEGGTQTFGLQRAPGAVIAISLCADWLGDYVDADERAGWLRTMGERGCEASFLALYGMRHPDRVEGWTMDESSTYFEHRPGDRIDLSNWPHILDRTNLKAVPASALAVGTVAYQQVLGEDENTARWLEQAIFSLRTFRDLFAVDGSYDEGVSYANYTSTHIAQATSVLRRHTDTDLYDLINWPGYVEYLQEMSMATAAEPKAIVNFGDAGNGATSAVPFWFAQHAHDGRAQWFGETLAREHDEWSLIWYRPDPQATPPPSRPHLWKSELDWIVGRTGYTPDDLVVAMRSGGPSNHEHADRNSLIVKCFGEELVADPYRPPYSFSDPSWMMRTTAGHSALLIDGTGHQYHDGSEGTNASDAVSRLVRYGERDSYLFWTSDATPAYQLVLPDVASVTRTIIVLHELPAVVVLDKVVKQTEPSTLQARFFGYNKDGEGRIEATDSGFQTFRPHASLKGFAKGSGNVQFETKHLPIADDLAPLHPFAEVATQDARLDPLLITVLLPQKSTDSQTIAQIAPQGDGTYEINIQQGDKTQRCRVFDTGTIPEFNIIT